MTMTGTNHKQEIVKMESGESEVLKGGSGHPVLVLHHDIGNPGWIHFYDALAKNKTVLVPSLPGYGKSTRPDWARTIRDMASLELWLLDKMGLNSVSVVGLGYGGWIAAEMAVMDSRRFDKLVLVNPMGVQPRTGEILDQFLINSTNYVKTGFNDAAQFKANFGEEPTPETLFAWEIAREMTTRVAWKPHMFSQSLPHLLPKIKTPALIVKSEHDKIVPPDCIKRYQEGMPTAKLEILHGAGHLADLDKPDALAGLINNFLK